MQNILDRAEQIGHEPAMPFHGYPGLTKREYLSGQMLAAMIANNDGEPMEYMAQNAVSAATLLLIKLAKSEVAK